MRTRCVGSRNLIQRNLCHKLLLILYLFKITKIVYADIRFSNSFTNVVDSVRQEAARLKDEGVEMLIALGHYGYAEDMAMAEQVSVV